MIKLTPKQRRLLLPLLSLLIISLGTYIAIQFAKGYRPTKTGLQGTGLLAANSFPPGAEVYLNQKLTTATDDTLNLPPGDYQVLIRKEGYSPWLKNLKIKTELVTQTNATLFRSVLSLTPLTLSGAVNIHPSPNGQKLAYVVASASAAAKNGLYVLELASNPLSLQTGPRLIARTQPGLDFAASELLWSPNSLQIIAHFQNSLGESSNYLLATDSFNEMNNLPDVTARLPLILSEWEEEISLRETRQFALLPQELQQIATNSATNLYFSPNESRLLYTGTRYLELPENLIKPPPGTNTQPEVRSLEPGGVYVYDLIEDRNYRIGSIAPEATSSGKQLLLSKSYQQSPTFAANTRAATTNPLRTYTQLQSATSPSLTMAAFKRHYSSLYAMPYQWYPDSAHLLIREKNATAVIEYDATNQVTLYAGPISGEFIYPWPDGSKLIVNLNLNPDPGSPTNLYAVDIR